MATLDQPPRDEVCYVCAHSATKDFPGNGVALVDCKRCGRYFLPTLLAVDLGLPMSDPLRQALASHLIRKSQGTEVFTVTEAFFEGLATRTLPSPAEAMDNMLLWCAAQRDGRPGARLKLSNRDLALCATVGINDGEDIVWFADNLASQGFLKGKSRLVIFDGVVTGQGWQRVEELRRAQVSSRFAFLARRFANPDLDAMFRRCLAPAVNDTGFDLRMASQVAGLIDAVIEDDIRRCRFLLADLTDANAGAYWEAGFAEGLGKPVIYIRQASKQGSAPTPTHFDTNHRQTVEWDLTKPEETARTLKAVIRNTLLGEANQDD